jgi:DNA-binding XRE family transcriptional regulator
MTMAQNARDLFRNLPEEAKRRARAKAEGIILTSRLARLRKRLGLTQKQLAHRLRVKQAAISRMEGRSDIRVSNLVRYLVALGGENIRIVADVDGTPTRIPLRR